jgi:predicted XRE-type DNA-binding protein
MTKSTKRPSLAQFKAEALEEPTFKVEYDALDAEFALMSQLIAARKIRKLSQEDVAKLLHKKQPAIARLESGGCYKTSIEKLHEYAHALGFNLEVKLVRDRQQ